MYFGCLGVDACDVVRVRCVCCSVNVVARVCVCGFGRVGMYGVAFSVRVCCVFLSVSVCVWFPVCAVDVFSMVCVRMFGCVRCGVCVCCNVCVCMIVCCVCGCVRRGVCL